MRMMRVSTKLTNTSVPIHTVASMRKCIPKVASDEPRIELVKMLPSETMDTSLSYFFDCVKSWL